MNFESPQEGENDQVVVMEQHPYFSLYEPVLLASSTCINPLNTQSIKCEPLDTTTIEKNNDKDKDNSLTTVTNDEDDIPDVLTWLHSEDFNLLDDLDEDQDDNCNSDNTVYAAKTVNDISIAPMTVSKSPVLSTASFDKSFSAYSTGPEIQDETSWTKMYELLPKFKIFPLHPFSLDRALESWVRGQYILLQSNKLSPDRTSRLGMIFDFNSLEWKRYHHKEKEKWIKMYQIMLIESDRNHRNSNGTVAYSKSLLAWFTRQRKEQNYLCTVQKKLLNDTGFCWETRAEVLKREWMKMFQLLVSYQEKHGGSTRVPYRSKIKIDGGKPIGLGSWVSSQRQYKKTGKLAQYRIDLLNSVCFDWHTGVEVKLIYDAKWMNMYHQLCAYKKTFGTDKLPPRKVKRYTKLSFWVDTQKRGGGPIPHRRQLLDKIGFCWRPSMPINICPCPSCKLSIKLQTK